MSTAALQGESRLAIVATGLERQFGKFRAVRDLTLQIHAGEVFGLLGPNGAGKTTLIRMLCGLISPTRGEAQVLGHDLARESEAIKRRVGYMSQRFSLYNDLSAQENLEFYGRIYGLRGADLRERVAELLAWSGLTGREAALAATLSGGWRQRLAFACAILHRPDLLFLDEPTSGVDPASRRRFWHFVYDQAASGVTVLVSTHYMDEAEHCDRIGLMLGGSLIALGPPGELKLQAKEGRLAGLSGPLTNDGETPTLEEVFVALAQDYRTVVAAQQGGR